MYFLNGLPHHRGVAVINDVERQHVLKAGIRKRQRRHGAALEDNRQPLFFRGSAGKFQAGKACVQGRGYKPEPRQGQ